MFDESGTADASRRDDRAGEAVTVARGRARRPTMRDVAAEAGVGVATVSRVVNGVDTVKAETAAEVRKAIGRLGFQRDEIARSLRPGQNSLTIGVMLGDLTNPFWSELAKGALEHLNKAGYAVLVTTADEDPTVARRSLEALISRRVAGLIVVPEGGSQSFLRGEGDRPRLPVVFVDRPPRGIDADVVSVDNEGGGRLATNHLIQHGHKRIAILVAPAYYTTGRRLRGYRRALRDSGLAVDADLIVHLSNGSASVAKEATAALLALDNPPTAVFSTTNFLTEGVLAALGPRHRSIAVVGFDDFRLAACLPTPMSVVATDTEELGRRAATLLLERINTTPDRARRIVLPVSLIQRGSGEIPPANTV